MYADNMYESMQPIEKIVSTKSKLEYWLMGLSVGQIVYLGNLVVQTKGDLVIWPIVCSVSALIIAITIGIVNQIKTDRFYHFIMTSISWGQELDHILDGKKMPPDSKYYLELSEHQREALERVNKDYLKQTEKFDDRLRKSDSNRVAFFVLFAVGTIFLIIWHITMYYYFKK